MTVGHGSPHVVLRKSPFAFCKHGWVVWTAALAVFASLHSSAAFAQQVGGNLDTSDSSDASSEPPQSTAVSPSVEKLAIELRIVWGGGTARAFNGNISVDGGPIKLVRNLSLQSDSIGSISSANSSTLSVAGHSASTFGGADVLIEGKMSSRVTIRFNHQTTNQPVEHSFLLSDVLTDRWLRNLDEHGNRIAAERQMQDRLRVHAVQSQSIFQTGTTWYGSLSGYRCGLQAGEHQLLVKLLDQNRGDTVVSEKEQSVSVDAFGNFNLPSLEVPLPQVESSYAIEFSLSRKGFLKSFVASAQPIKRRVDLVVFDYAAPPNRIEYWTHVATIKPLNSQWWSSVNWFSSLNSGQSLVQLPAFSENKRAVNHGTQSSRKVGEEDCLILGPSSWQAYPLTIEHSGQPYRLRVRVPRDQPQQLVISIRDFHTSGDPTNLNVDSGIVLGERQVNSQATTGLWAEHEIIFWPRSTKPMLMLFNASLSEDAAFGELQLDVGQVQPTPPLNPAREGIDSSTGSDEATRMVAFYMTKPLLADAFGAQRSIDPVTNRALDSWLTWQQAAERLTQHMQNAGYNTLILNVAGDGGAVLPLSRLAPTTRFDSGSFFSDGRSPDIKDFVELLCNHLDRSGLRLILTLDLNSHLPSLAKWESNESKTAGLFQVNLEGKAWQFDTDASNRRILYNPLHPQVQAEFQQIVREVCSRYGAHKCFKGLALELGEASHLVFAGDRWGYDAPTLQKFEASSQSKLPSREALSQPIQNGLRLAYLNWRARELSTFLVRLAETVTSAKADAKLLLNPIYLWQRQPSEHDYVDAISMSRNLNDVLLAAGLDIGWLKQQPNIALLRGQFESALGSDVERAWLSRAASDPGMAHASVGNSSGTVQLQRPIGIVIPDGGKLNGQNSQNPFQTSSSSSPVWCYPIATSIGPNVRKSFIEQLYREDSLLMADGTWMPPQSDSMQLAGFRKTLVELPNTAMHSIKVDRDDSNVRLRSIKVGNDTYLQLINNASWTEHVTMDVKIADISGVYEVLGGKELEISGGANSSSRKNTNGSRASTVWQFHVDPYDLVGFKISDPQFKLNNFIHSSEPALVDRLKTEIDTLENRLTLISDTARDAESLDVPGGDFEDWIDGVRPIGWTASSLPDVTIKQERSLPHSGVSCVAIENRNQAEVSAWLQSEKIRIPDSGRIVVSAWVRVPTAGIQPQILRLSLIGRTRDGRRYQRSHQFGPQTRGSEMAADWGKRPVTLFVTDLPSAELTELRIAFDLVGPGKVWVDDIHATEAYLSPDERALIRGQVFLAKERLRENNAYPAEQLLNSHLARYLASVELKTTEQTQLDQEQIITPAKPVNSGRRSNSPPLLKQFRETMRERWQK